MRTGAHHGLIAGQKAAEDQARKEACFRAHGKHMSKPALMNPNDCWRAHGYLMER